MLGLRSGENTEGRLRLHPKPPARKSDLTISPALFLQPASSGHSHPLPQPLQSSPLDSLIVLGLAEKRNKHHRQGSRPQDSAMRALQVGNLQVKVEAGFALRKFLGAPLLVLTGGVQALSDSFIFRSSS